MNICRVQVFVLDFPPRQNIEEVQQRFFAQEFRRAAARFGAFRVFSSNKVTEEVTACEANWLNEDFSFHNNHGFVIVVQMI